MESTYAIISHDRHRDDYVYIIFCKDEDRESYISKIWNQDFRGSEAGYKSNRSYGDGSGDYEVFIAELKTISSK